MGGDQAKGYPTHVCLLLQIDQDTQEMLRQLGMSNLPGIKMVPVSSGASQLMCFACLARTGMQVCHSGQLALLRMQVTAPNQSGQQDAGMGPGRGYGGQRPPRR